MPNYTQEDVERAVEVLSSIKVRAPAECPNCGAKDCPREDAPRQLDLFFIFYADTPGHTCPQCGEEWVEQFEFRPDSPLVLRRGEPQGKGA